MTKLKAVAIGAGYFSQFHFDGWQRIPEVELLAICDTDISRAEAAMQKYGIPRHYSDVATMLDKEQPDFVDIITRPDTHDKLCQLAFDRGIHVICQKPLAPTYEQSQKIVEQANVASVRFMVHENFRFQPWYREIRRLIDLGEIGDKLHGLSFRARPGDGWGDDAYLARQPYFREMERLLIYETGVHFIDTFRFLAGEVDEVYAVLSRHNAVIQGEDAALVTFQFASGATGVWDANRYNEGTDRDPRYTFGQMLVDGNGGSIRLYGDGRLTIQKLGGEEMPHEYLHERRGFAGDCAYLTQRHFVDGLIANTPFETDGNEYLKTLKIQEAIYESSKRHQAIKLGSPSRQYIDLSLTIDENLPRATVTPAMTIAKDGWNATTLTLYSHCGTHMDAPCHFLEDGRTIDEQSLATCCGSAKVLDLSPIAPRELITIERIRTATDEVNAGDRLLLRTDWHKRFGTPEYRDGLPRISAECARWLVERRVALIGVEPPSVADVNNIEEVTEIHRILLGGGIVIVEGLVNLDQLPSKVEFIALPLKIRGGDGCPVRAIAVV
ncbi:MAG: cyclase family protein [Planctomycetaceae bacterium]|nr:cyclase family protein [Planctomycetales bacterium]MCB9940087.1 cyclase family protein [Planctomycetaceae bacterium]